MNIQIGKKALITTDNWFHAPDGNTYRAVHGTVRAVRSDADTLGVKTNARSTNWYVEIGNMTVAGCQIHYAIRTDTCHFGERDGESDVRPDYTRTKMLPAIYNADVGEGRGDG